MALKTRKIPATDENMSLVNDFIHSFIPDECSPEVLNKIDLAVEEIYINIAHYAYGEETGSVDISCEFFESEKRLRIVFSDSGKPFNPLTRGDPDITLSADEREIGGLGIFLTKKFMDKIEYDYADEKNVLAIEKIIQ